MIASTPLSTPKPVSMFRIGVLIVLAAAASAGLLFLPVHEYLSWFLAWVHDIGSWGAVLLGAAYIPAAFLFIPGSLLTLGAGFAFGVELSTVAVSIGSTVGASAAFLMGRALARGVIEAKVSRSARFRAIDQAVQLQGFKIVLLTRLSPVFPLNLLNYAFGLTPGSLRDYVLASWIGMLPGTVMYVYLGSAVKNLADLAAGNVAGGIGQKILSCVELAATVAVTVVITRIGKRAFNTTASGTELEQQTHSSGEKDGA